MGIQEEEGYPRPDVTQINTMFKRIQEIDRNPNSKEAQEYYKNLSELERT